MEKCERCQEEGSDRKTLWMACFYDMLELNLPFDDTAIKGKLMKYAGVETREYGNYPIFEDDETIKERMFRFFTMRVCKQCRAAWMIYIRDWFENFDPNNRDSSIQEGDTYIREFGVAKRKSADDIARIKEENT